MHSTITAEDQKFNARLYQLYISKNGDLLNPESRNEVVNEGESEDEYISGEDEYISKIFENFEKEREKKKPNDLQLLIYVHGGLNTFNSATSRVNEHTVNEMIADGKYPLFISWNAEGPSNYSDHLFSLRRGVIVGKPWSDIFTIRFCRRYYAIRSSFTDINLQCIDQLPLQISKRILARRRNNCCQSKPG